MLHKFLEVPYHICYLLDLEGDLHLVLYQVYLPQAFHPDVPMVDR